MDTPTRSAGKPTSTYQRYSRLPPRISDRMLSRMDSDTELAATEWENTTINETPRDKESDNQRDKEGTFDRYYGWAKIILDKMSNSKDLSITREWLDFIYKNRNTPVMLDFIRVFVFSLHLRYRVKPFDERPSDSIVSHPRFDVVNAGSVLTSRLGALEQRMSADENFAWKIIMRDRHYNKDAFHICGESEKPNKYFPRVHVSNYHGTKEYFATQEIPKFGRHCWYAFGSDEFPYKYEHEHPKKPKDERSRKDMLGRLAEHLHNMELNKHRPITQRDIESFRLTTRDWWKWNDPNDSVESEQSSSEDEEFRWHKDSIFAKGFKLDPLLKLDELKSSLREVPAAETQAGTIECPTTPSEPVPSTSTCFGLSKGLRSEQPKEHIHRDVIENLKELQDILDKKEKDDYTLDSKTSGSTQVNKLFEELDKEFPPSHQPRTNTSSPCPRISSPPPCPKTSAPSSFSMDSSWPWTNSPPPTPMTSSPISFPRTSSPESWPKTSTSSPCPRISSPPPCQKSSSPSPFPLPSSSEAWPRTSTSSPCPRINSPLPSPRTSAPSSFSMDSSWPWTSSLPPAPMTSSPLPCPKTSPTSLFPRTSSPESWPLASTSSQSARISSLPPRPDKTSSPSPFPRTSSPQLRPRASTSSPCPRTRTSSPSSFPRTSSPPPCPRTSSPPPCTRISSPPCPRTSSPLPFLRTTSPPPWPRISTSSPCPRASSPSPFPRDSSCPWASSPSPSPRTSLRFPFPKTSSPPPFPRTSSPQPCPMTSSSPPCPRARPPSPFSRSSSFPSRPRATSPPPFPGTSSPPWTRSTSPPQFPSTSADTPVFDTRSNIYSKDVSFAREVADRIGDPYGPPEIVNAAISAWFDELESSLQERCPSAEKQPESFQPSSRPSFSFQGAEEAGPSDAPDLPGSDFAEAWGRNSLDFENAKELSFVDQFILPTADIRFDEEAQDAANPFGGFDESDDDDWVAPPEVVPSEYPGLAPSCSSPDSEETEKRRAGKLFLPPPQTSENTTEDLGVIDWPDRTHIYDINTDFPKTDKPFEFLDVSQFRHVDDMGDIFNEIPEEQDKWLNLADVADQIGQK